MNKTISSLSILIAIPSTMHGMKNNKLELVELSSKPTEKKDREMAFYRIHRLKKGYCCHSGGKWGSSDIRCCCESDIKEAASKKYKNFCEQITYLDPDTNETITTTKTKEANGILIYFDSEGKIVEATPFGGIHDQKVIEEKLNSKPKVRKLIKIKYPFLGSEYRVFSTNGRLIAKTYTYNNNLKKIKENCDLDNCTYEEQNSCPIL